MDIWIGIVIGLVIGVPIGVMLTCILVVSRVREAEGIAQAERMANRPLRERLETTEESMRQARLCLMIEEGEHQCWGMKAAKRFLDGEPLALVAIVPEGR
jgi:hypothetical protein